MIDDRELDAWLDDAGTAAQWDVDEPPARPSFGELVARARALDADAVPADWPSNPTEPERDDEVSAAAGRTEAADALLDDLVASARTHAEADAHERTLAGVPSLRRRLPIGRVAAVVGVAAVAVVAFAVGDLVSLRARWGPNDAPPSQAAAELHDDEPTQRAPQRPEPARPRPSTNAVEPADDPPATPSVQTEPSVEDSRAVERRRGRDRPALDELLRELDEKAERLLVAGDVDGADALYARIIGRGGRRTIVELAFSDRFTIAHRRGDVAHQRRLWRAYLRRFPKGRFADDARAGLCRHTDDEAACWHRYLEDFPSGAYRSQARRIVGEPTP